MVNENWALFSEIGFWGWIISVTGLLVYTYTRNTDTSKFSTILLGALAVVFYVIWVYGMISA